MMGYHWGFTQFQVKCSETAHSNYPFLFNQIPATRLLFDTAAYSLHTWGAFRLGFSQNT